MVEISIICLVYKSKFLAQAVYDSVLKYTPKLATGEAEFFFVANDPTEDVVDYLKAKDIPHFININEHLSDEHLFELGIGKPEYIRRVYQGYNFGVLKAKGQRVVLINSDNFFSPDWLENLLKYSDYKRVVCSTLVEPGQEKFDVFPFAIEKNFGRTLDDFNESAFQDFAEKNSKTGYFSEGAYMPCLLYKDVAVMAGLYPEGNIAGKTFEEIDKYGDEYFYHILKGFGIEHITAKDSIVYHLKEGEKAEGIADTRPFQAAANKPIQLNKQLIVHPKSLISYVRPDSRHEVIMDELARKITVLIISPADSEEVDAHLATIGDFNFKHIEVILISDNKQLVKGYDGRLTAIYADSGSLYGAIYEILHHAYGEFFLSLDRSCSYAKELLDNIDDKNKTYYIGKEDVTQEEISDCIGNFIVSKPTVIANIKDFTRGYASGRHMTVRSDSIPLTKIVQDLGVPESVSEPALLTRRARYKDRVKRGVNKLRHAGVKEFYKAIYRRLRQR